MEAEGPLGFGGFFDANRALSLQIRASCMTPWRSPLAGREHHPEQNRRLLHVIDKEGVRADLALNKTYFNTWMPSVGYH